MFTKKVTDDDNFMELSASAQALYLHLSMSADDDGFCNQVSISMFKAHASVQDLQALLEKRYIYQFENGVIVIKHWRMANALRKDRYTPTVFKEELSKLRLKDNGSYTITNEDESTRLPFGCHVVADCLPQDRIGKDSIGNNICSNSLSEIEQKEDKKSQNDELEKNFKIIYGSYPKKVGKARGFDLYKGWLKGRDISGRKVKLTNKQMWDAIAKYKQQLEQDGTEKQYIKQFDTFMCKAILDYVEDEE